MAKQKEALYYLAPSGLAFCVLILDIFISDWLHNKFYAVNTGCGAKPSAFVTVLLALVGLAIAIYGIINAFKNHHKWVGAIAIVLALFVLLVGLVSLFVLSFEICF
jgi:hypothetical protein